MPELSRALVLAAGAGSRVAAEYTADVAEKPRLPIVPADPEVPDDIGVTTLDLVMGNLALVGSLEEITILVNPDSKIPDRYREAIDRRKLLGRQDRLRYASTALSGKIACRYAVQPKRSPDEPRYGTNFAIALGLGAMKPDAGETVLITECDGMHWHSHGHSIFNPFITSAASLREATAAILVTGIPEDTASQNGLVESEIIGGAEWFVDINEANENGEGLYRSKPGIRKSKNLSVYYADELLRECVSEVMETPPTEESGGEFQVTNALKLYVLKGGKIAVVQSPEGFSYIDIGNRNGLRVMRERAQGLANARNPAWHYEAAA
jgi:hypothetical protein